MAANHDVNHCAGQLQKGKSCDACATTAFDGKLDIVRRKASVKQPENRKSEITDELISSALSPFAVAVDPTSAEQIRTFTELLLHWNEKVGLTTVTEPREILERHFGESFFGARAVPISHGRLADVGSGAGFPGLPIKLLVPSVEVILIESNKRKAVFLAEVVRTLKLSGICIEARRFEDLQGPAWQFDYVCSRALGNVEKLLAWSSNVLNPDGQLVLWLGLRDAREISSRSQWIWAEPILVPVSKQRVILAGSPVRG